MAAFLLVVALFALVVLPGLIALRRQRAVAVAGLFYAALFFALGAFHIGLPERAEADLTRAPPGLMTDEGTASSMCGRIVNESRRAGIIAGRPNPRQVQVNRELWAQMPDQVKEAITICVRAPTRPGAPQNDVEIVEVDGP